MPEKTLDVFKSNINFLENCGTDDSGECENTKFVIEPDNPIYDYYDDENWGDSTTNKEFSITIIAEPINKDLVKTAVKTALADENLELLNFPEVPTHEEIVSLDILKKIEKEILPELEKFVKSVTVTLVNQFVGTVLTLDTAAFGSKQTKYASANEMFKNHRNDTAIILYNELQSKLNTDQLGNVLDCARIYYAYLYIDLVWRESDYFLFMRRLVMLTKVVFACRLLILGASATSSLAEARLYDLVRWLYSDIKKYVFPTLSDTSGFDDIFNSNVIKSKEIRDRSVQLQGKKESVEAIQNNLRTIENSDRLASRRRRNMRWGYIGVSIFVVLFLAALAYCLVTGRTGVMYALVSLVACVVLASEALHGVEKLVNL